MKKRLIQLWAAMLLASLFGSLLGPASARLPELDALAAAGRISLPSSSSHSSRASAVGLSEDPVEAAIYLAEQVYQASLPEAQTAAVELFRRVGVPVVSPDGPVAAMPDHLVLVEAAIYEGQVERIVRTVRSGSYYTPEQLSELLAGLFEAEAIPPELLIGALGQWGKSADAPVESRAAGAAVRALAAQRGQVLFAEAGLDEMEIDLLQTAFILAHLTSRTQERRPGAGSAYPTLVGWRSAKAQGPCDQLYDALNPKKNRDELVDELLKEQLVDLIKEYAKKKGKDLEAVLAAYNEAMEVVSIFYLLLAAEIKMIVLNPKPHFHHKPADHSGAHTTAEAKATFESGMEPEEVKCYALAGIKVPPPGPMEGFRVRWRIYQPRNRLGEGKYLKVMANHGRKLDACGSCGDVLGADGVSRLPMYTPVEPEPEKGVVSEGRVRVVAALDKDEFPLKATDFLIKSGSDIVKWPKKKMLDLVKSAVTRAGLPNAVTVIPVEYHGEAVYRMKGSRNVWGFYYILPISVDLYSCSGLEGPWLGTATLGTDSSRVEDFFRDLAGSVVGMKFPGPGQKLVEQKQFTISPGSRQSVTLLEGPGISGDVLIDSRFQSNQRPYQGVVGRMEVYLGGHSFGEFKETGSTPFIVMIEGVENDSRCQGKDARYENE